MKTINSFILLFCFILVGCSQIDEYDAPKETLIGRIIDKNTGLPLLSETNGTRIKYEELSWGDTPTPTYSAVKQDGTFRNTKVFEGRYLITPVDGPFFPVEGKEIEIKGEKSLDFEVEPFLNIKIEDIALNGTDANINFKISRSKEAFKITDAKVFISYTNFVGNNAFLTDKPGQKLSPSINLEKIDDATILSTTYSLEVKGLEKGRTYYLRVGARTKDNVQKRYNYSEIKQVQL